MVQPGRPQIIIWRKSTACWINKATNTQAEYVILLAFPLQQQLFERASLLRHKYIACLFGSCTELAENGDHSGS